MLVHPDPRAHAEGHPRPAPPRSVRASPRPTFGRHTTRRMPTSPSSTSSRPASGCARATSSAPMSSPSRSRSTHAPGVSSLPLRSTISPKGTAGAAVHSASISLSGLPIDRPQRRRGRAVSQTDPPATPPRTARVPMSVTFPRDSRASASPLALKASASPMSRLSSTTALATTPRRSSPARVQAAPCSGRVKPWPTAVSMRSSQLRRRQRLHRFRGFPRHSSHGRGATLPCSRRSAGMSPSARPAHRRAPADGTSSPGWRTRWKECRPRR